MKCYGIELKSVKYWEGHDGYGCSANIYINGKKAGRYYDDGNGGKPDIDMISPEYAKKLKELTKKWFKFNPVDLTGFDFTKLKGKTFEEVYPYFVDEEALIDILLIKKDEETHYKKHLKEGCTHMVSFTYPLFAKGPHPVIEYGFFGGENVDKCIERFIAEKQAKFPLLKPHIYTTPSDFIIREPAE